MNCCPLPANPAAKPSRGFPRSPTQHSSAICAASPVRRLPYSPVGASRSPNDAVNPTLAPNTGPCYDFENFENRCSDNSATEQAPCSVDNHFLFTLQITNSWFISFISLAPSTDNLQFIHKCLNPPLSKNIDTSRDSFLENFPITTIVHLFV